MVLNTGVKENLRFLLVEVIGQLDSLIQYLVAGYRGAAQRVIERRGYAENLKRRIHQDCLQQLAASGGAEQAGWQYWSVEAIAGELETISDLCRDCVDQLRALDSTDALRVGSHGKRLHEIGRGLDWVIPALESSDVRLAQRLADLEGRIGRRCRKLHRRYSQRLRKPRKTRQLVAGLFIARNIEQMAGCLLNISDAVLSSRLGQPINLRRFNGLQRAIGSSKRLRKRDDLILKPLAETRSGSAVAALADKASTRRPRYLAIYKGGDERKLQEERAGVEQWHQLYPGLAPRIIDYSRQGETATLLIEHLAGPTFEHLLLHQTEDLLHQALKQLGKTLHSVWRETLLEQPAMADFIGQTAARMDEVYAVHPEFARHDQRIGDVYLPGFDQLLARARGVEACAQAPFAVFIHGDFNVDNIIYDVESDQIRFIDLHRSCYQDYVQDVSVFMVSCYRLQVFDSRVRRRILLAVLDCYETARQFARQREDLGFELRLALGLARSFATSTRFILDEALAAAMFLRARYLLEQVIAADGQPADAFALRLSSLFRA